jgi:hypothetical protein
METPHIAKQFGEHLQETFSSLQDQQGCVLQLWFDLGAYSLYPVDHIMKLNSKLQAANAEITKLKYEIYCMRGKFAKIKEIAADE